MEIREMRARLGDTQSEFAARYNIPFRTIQNWETGLRKPPEYIIDLLNSRVQADLINRRTAVLPKSSTQKLSVPDRRNYVGALSWLKAVQDRIGEPFVFALDEALMCDGSFGGRSDEYVVWIYGDESLARFNGVAVIGNGVSRYYVKERNGLLYTSFNRTLIDALANESILDMQGITEALSRYYYTHDDSFDGLFIPPEYQSKFEELADEAVDYYTN